MKGSHGPAYYKRYPAAFERFTPVCSNNQLDQCEDQAIRNAYDNTLLYTDHVLGQVIDLLKRNARVSTARCCTSRTMANRWGEGRLPARPALCHGTQEEQTTCRWCCGCRSNWPPEGCVHGLHGAAQRGRVVP
jgi:hypothetical protein